MEITRSEGGMLHNLLTKERDGGREGEGYGREREGEGGRGERGRAEGWRDGGKMEREIEREGVIKYRITDYTSALSIHVCTFAGVFFL